MAPLIIGGFFFLLLFILSIVCSFLLLYSIGCLKLYVPHTFSHNESHIYDTIEIRFIHNWTAFIIKITNKFCFGRITRLIIRYLKFVSFKFLTKAYFFFNELRVKHFASFLIQSNLLMKSFKLYVIWAISS